jgi:hypothetical protein
MEEFGFFRMLPVELQLSIWKYALDMDMPGVHFFEVCLARRRRRSQPGVENRRRIQLCRPIKVKYEDVNWHAPSEDFPALVTSSYETRARVAASCRLARSVFLSSLVEPKEIQLGRNGGLVTIDAARDLVYLKFLWGPWQAGGADLWYEPMPDSLVASPITDAEVLDGIRNVALEMARETSYVGAAPQQNTLTCFFCGKQFAARMHRCKIGPQPSITNFLGHFRDLEDVYFVVGGPRSTCDMAVHNKTMTREESLEPEQKQAVKCK